VEPRPWIREPETIDAPAGSGVLGLSADHGGVIVGDIICLIMMRRHRQKRADRRSLFIRENEKVACVPV